MSRADKGIDLPLKVQGDVGQGARLRRCCSLGLFTSFPISHFPLNFFFCVRTCLALDAQRQSEKNPQRRGLGPTSMMPEAGFTGRRPSPTTPIPIVSSPFISLCLVSGRGYQVDMVHRSTLCNQYTSHFPKVRRDLVVTNCDNSFPYLIPSAGLLQQPHQQDIATQVVSLITFQGFGRKKICALPGCRW